MIHQRVTSNEQQFLTKIAPLQYSVSFLRTIIRQKGLFPCALSSEPLALCHQPKGLSPNGLANGSALLLPSPLGGGFGGVVVIITREIELSRITLVTTGLMYDFLDDILLYIVFKCRKIIYNQDTKILY